MTNHALIKEVLMNYIKTNVPYAQVARYDEARTAVIFYEGSNRTSPISLSLKNGNIYFSVAKETAE